MNKTADRTVALDKGRVDVYTKNGVTLYAYQTRDLIDNEVLRPLISVSHLPPCSAPHN